MLVGCGLGASSGRGVMVMAALSAATSNKRARYFIMIIREWKQGA